MAKFVPVITKDLQETVRKNPNIKTVYFDGKGNHYFNKHSIDFHEDNGSGISKGAKKVDALPGVKQGVLKVKVGNDIKDKKVNIGYNAVECEMDRDEILDAETGKRVYSEAEKKEILAAAAEINKLDGKGKGKAKAKEKEDDEKTGDE